MNYDDFLHSKIQIAPNSGFSVSAKDIHPALKPHQRDAVMWAIRGGRRALIHAWPRKAMDCDDRKPSGVSVGGRIYAPPERMRETVDKYATAARVIALHLKPFCNESLPYDEMIADAARKASDELEQVKRERDAIEQDFRAFTKQWWEQDSGFPCRWCKFENSGGCEWKTKQTDEEKICAGRAFEWRGPKKED